MNHHLFGELGCCLMALLVLIDLAWTALYLLDLLRIWLASRSPYLP